MLAQLVNEKQLSFELLAQDASMQKQAEHLSAELTGQQQNLVTLEAEFKQQQLLLSAKAHDISQLLSQYDCQNEQVLSQQLHDMQATVAEQAQVLLNVQRYQTLTVELHDIDKSSE